MNSMRSIVLIVIGSVLEGFASAAQNSVVVVQKQHPCVPCELSEDLTKCENTVKDDEILADNGKPLFKSLKECCDTLKLAKNIPFDYAECMKPHGPLNISTIEIIVRDKNTGEINGESITNLRTGLGQCAKVITRGDFFDNRDCIQWCVDEAYKGGEDVQAIKKLSLYVHPKHCILPGVTEDTTTATCMSHNAFENCRIADFSSDLTKFTFKTDTLKAELTKWAGVEPAEACRALCAVLNTNQAYDGRQPEMCEYAQYDEHLKACITHRADVLKSIAESKETCDYADCLGKRVDACPLKANIGCMRQADNIKGFYRHCGANPYHTKVLCAEPTSPPTRSTTYHGRKTTTTTTRRHAK